MEKEKILYCDSQGDKRFSALYAQITIDGVTNTIENFYQGCKRDSLGNIPGKGKHVDHVIWKGVKRPASDLTPLYEELWELYFKENPNLLQYASQFNKFIDRFKGKSINSQADVICKLVKINKIGGEKIMQKEILKVKSIKQLNHYYYSGDRELLFCIDIESLDLESLIKLSSYAKSDFKFIGKGGLVVNDKVIDKCREIIYGMDIDSLSLKDTVSISNYAKKDTIKNDEIISKCRESIYGMDIESLDFEDLIILGGYATKDNIKNYEVINKCREIILEKYTSIDVPIKENEKKEKKGYNKKKPDYKTLTKHLKIIRDLFCIKEIKSFTKEVRDEEFYSAGVIDTEIVCYFEYIPIIPITIQINGDADLYMKMVHGYCIDGKETQPLIEKVKGLTVKIVNPFGEMETFNHMDIRYRWEKNRIACANECTQYSIENPIIDNSIFDKLGMVLSAYAPHRIVKNDLGPMYSDIDRILIDAKLKYEEIGTALYKIIIKQEPKAVDAFINYCLDTNVKIYNFVDINKVNELYETIKPELYGNSNYLEAQIYNFTEDDE